MAESTKGKKLTVFVDGDARHESRPVYEIVIEVIRAHRLREITAFRGAMGYHGSEIIHSNLNEITMSNLPVIVEAVDDVAKVEATAEAIARILGDHGLVQMQPTTFTIRANQNRSES